MKFGKMAFSIATLSIKTFRIMKFGILTLSIMAFCITTSRIA